MRDCAAPFRGQSHGDLRAYRYRARVREKSARSKRSRKKMLTVTGVNDHRHGEVPNGPAHMGACASYCHLLRLLEALKWDAARFGDSESPDWDWGRKTIIWRFGSLSWEYPEISSTKTINLPFLNFFGGGAMSI